jgi:hypothetical protein
MFRHVEKFGHRAAPFYSMRSEESRFSAFSPKYAWDAAARFVIS